MAVVIPASYAQNYKPIEITNIKPVDILPIIGQIEAGDKKAYDHIEHLRIVEAMRIREMMWQYGAGNNSAEEYQQLMNRLNTGMTMENPKGYDNFEKLGGEFSEDPSNHAHDEWDILNTLVAHANFKVCNPIAMNGEMDEHLKKEVDKNPNNIYIFGCSAYACVDKETYSYWNMNSLKDLCKSKNLLIFVAGSNIGRKN